MNPMANKTSLGRYRNAKLLEQYAAEIGGGCELWQWLPAADRREVQRLRQTNLRKPPELHHIWYNARHKYDLRSNIVGAGYVLHHAWGHTKHPIELKIVSMYAKWAKDDPAEFNLEELREAAGQCPIAWLDRMRGRYEVGSEWWNLATEIIEFE